MSAQVSNHNFTNIGRMFARQNVPAVYGRQKSADGADPEAAAEAVDRVSLSSMAPKPLQGGMLKDALDTGRIMESGGKLSGDRVERLRQDRIYSAISALAALGDDGDANTMPRSWPGGLPAPTREEMEIARRRLAQRFVPDENVDNPEVLQQDRLDLLRKIRNRDFSAPAGETADAMATAGASA